MTTPVLRQIPALTLALLAAEFKLPTARRKMDPEPRVCGRLRALVNPSLDANKVYRRTYAPEQ